MPQIRKPRAGSLQVYPRIRIHKILPHVNWDAVNAVHNPKEGLQGFIGYKVGMMSVYVKDNTADSMTKGKKIIVPGTILECPQMKIYSVRFLKGERVIKESVVNFDDELKSILKKPAKLGLEEPTTDYDNIQVIVYSLVKKTSNKKTPDIIELGFGGTKDKKLAFIKEHLNKEISILDIFKDGLVDVRGVTKGKGYQGPVKRYGIHLKQHKSEKGVRRPGTLGPWHPNRVSFRAPISGQVGLHTRLSYNLMILKLGKTSENNINIPGGFKHYGEIKNDYIIVKGSVPGPQKRALLITPAIKPTKKPAKQKYEFLELR